MLNHPRVYARHGLLARRVGPTFAERVAALRTLNRLESATHSWTGNKEVTVDILGHPMCGFDPDTMKFLFHEVFLTHSYRFMSEVPDPVIVDCGANIGFSILYFKRAYPNARIYAFEANPHAFRLLQRNVEVNGFHDVVAHQVALSDQDGEIAFYISDDPGTLVGSVRADRGGDQRLIVDAQRLSTTLAALDRADVVKMDVEGAEWKVLADLCESGTLGKPHRYIIEYHHQLGAEPPRLTEFLIPFEQAGFRYHVSGDIGNPTGFQDVMIHLVRDSAGRA